MLLAHLGLIKTYPMWYRLYSLLKSACSDSVTCLRLPQLLHQQNGISLEELALAYLATLAESSSLASALDLSDYV